MCCRNRSRTHQPLLLKAGAAAFKAIQKHQERKRLANDTTTQLSLPSTSGQKYPEQAPAYNELVGLVREMSLSDNKQTSITDKTARAIPEVNDLPPAYTPNTVPVTNPVPAANATVPLQDTYPATPAEELTNIHPLLTQHASNPLIRPHIIVFITAHANLQIAQTIARATGSGCCGYAPQRRALKHARKSLVEAVAGLDGGRAGCGKRNGGCGGARYGMRGLDGALRGWGHAGCGTGYAGMGYGSC